MGKYYSVHGKEITMEQWAIAYEYGPHTVRYDKVGDFIVSTVWLGLDHNYIGGGKPIVFETMVFKAKGKSTYIQSGTSFEERRWSTLTEAIAGHLKMCAKWRKK